MDTTFTRAAFIGAESIWIFDPADSAQSVLAIKLVGAKRKRVVILTDAQKQALRDRLQAARTGKAACVFVLTDAHMVSAF